MIVETVKSGVNYIGRLGENEARVMRFPVRETLCNFPGCTFMLFNKRPGDSSAYPSPNIEVRGNYLYWTVTSGDLVRVGFGEVEVTATVDGKVVKDDIYQTEVKTALDGSGTVPDPWQGWVTQITDAADRADEAVEHYPKIVEGIWTVWDVENEQWVSTGIHAEGQPGDPGQPGADGVSPVASVSKVGKVSTLTVTDASGTTSVEIHDGEDGAGADLIDDTAGEGDTDKVWSANKTDTEVKDLKSALTVLEPSASSGDVGKFLKAKTVSDGKVSEYEFGSLPSVPVTDVQVNGSSVLSQGVANIPFAGGSRLGVIKTGTGNGIYIDSSSGEAYVSRATDDQIKAGNGAYRPITPTNQHSSAFFGLAKASGDTTQSSSSNAVGVYTETAKSSIAQMLDAPETVSGSTPSITAKAGVRYICGECSTLSITAPASGCIDVVFESGATPTVLTLASAKTGVTSIKFPAWFNSASLVANTTYEINILDGEYGTVMAWT